MAGTLGVSMKQKIFCVAAGVFIMSCATAYHYDFSLLSVERPPRASEQYGPVKIEKDADSLTARYRFSDSLVAGVFSINAERFEISCRNKTDRSIKIDWEKAVYINPFGVRRRVIHSGIRYERKVDAQAPSIIRKGETLADYLLPSENVNVYLYGSGGFSVYPLFSTREYGRTAKVLLPLDVDGVVNEYLFQFKISAAQ
jgi:hypothetical protein